MPFRSTHFPLMKQTQLQESCDAYSALKFLYSFQEKTGLERSGCSTVKKTANELSTSANVSTTEIPSLMHQWLLTPPTPLPIRESIGQFDSSEASLSTATEAVLKREPEPRCTAPATGHSGGTFYGHLPSNDIPSVSASPATSPATVNYASFWAANTSLPLGYMGIPGAAMDSTGCNNNSSNNTALEEALSFALAFSSLPAASLPVLPALYPSNTLTTNLTPFTSPLSSPCMQAMDPIHFENNCSAGDKTQQADGHDTKPKRHNLPKAQFEWLKQRYLETPRPSRQQTREWSKLLGMEQRAVRVWFENKRAVAKRQEERKRRGGVGRRDSGSSEE
ncbi:hypothetical protein BCR33DRAFT_717585 [Rhizoclosmatium globosum]|uniref:Homeobox domain-containing protein n=1 Tax=Rhizoclosmatium globosum TaxID=329046 RepID=A0A1Y2C8W4_9FUNG|nr:hypothetical protein BCR33DRAFT_717585 [Rhizoclosmatium globosum]|eukprot:ORY43357.1 hypothetical protein BCR33DRAFT_717585 [Rhizoclosmatium globosum]